MKRYRVLAMNFDARASHLEIEIKEEWDPKIKEMHRSNKHAIMEGLLNEYGTYVGFKKIMQFTEMGPAPFSIISFHNKFLQQIRDSFTMGAFYPALAAACALGERILNQLILNLKDCYKSTLEYKKIYRKQSFDSWEDAISILEAWDVLLPNVTIKFRELMKLRHRTLHFNPETDKNDHELALSAVITLSDIITSQFSAVGNQPWYFIVNGATFVKRTQENIPFVRKIVIPCCQLVGPLHTLELKRDTFVVNDDYNYEDHVVSDEEYSTMYINRKL